MAAPELMNDIICNCGDFCTGDGSSNSEPCNAAYKCDWEADMYMGICTCCVHIDAK